MTQPAWQIGTCAPEDRPTALRLIGDGLSADSRDVLAAAIGSTLAKVQAQSELARADGPDGLSENAPLAQTAWEGLLSARARSTGLITGAAWVQRQPGNTAILWPPAMDSPAAMDLLIAAAAWSDKRAIRLTQWSASTTEAFCEATWRQAKFSQIAELIYYSASTQTTSCSQSPHSMQFEPNAGLCSDRLQRVIFETYRQTLDCPRLEGIRPLEEVLQGYREQGRWMPDQWYFIRSEGRDVGTILLADHPATGSWELVYMGLSPTVRGRGWGRLAAEFAVRCAGLGGAERVVLAVDAANLPAISAYLQAGFQAWDRRTVYAHWKTDTLSTELGRG